MNYAMSWNTAQKHQNTLSYSMAPRIGKFIETDSSCDSVSNKNVLETDRCDVCTILSMYSKPLNHTLKTVKLVDFTCVFHNKKVSA